jgi:GTP-binding protein YchF
MGFKCGLVGLPNAGKSTIFNAMTNLGVEATAYPFCTIDPHFGIVPLPDDRLDDVWRLIGSGKKTPTILEFVDLAGLIKGASKGEGLGNQFLSHISRVDAIVHVVRCFEDENVPHPDQTLDPVRDAKNITTELILKDAEWIERRVQKIKAAARSGDQSQKRSLEAFEPILGALLEEKEIRSLELTDIQKELMNEMGPLTVKPVIFLANVDEKHLSDSPLVRALEAHAAEVETPCLTFAGKIEAEIAELPAEEQLEFRMAMGLRETGLEKIVKTGFEVLDLITFFTANENETHAWTIPRGTAAQQAAGRVHTDFEQHFIRTEVVKIRDLRQYGSMKALHDHGLVAVHGRDYWVEDGDLLLFKTGK